MRPRFPAKLQGTAKLLIQHPIFQSTEVPALFLETGSINTKWLSAYVLSSANLPTMCRCFVSAGVGCHLPVSATAFASGL